MVLTLVSLFAGGGLSRVGDMGALPTTLPFFGLPKVPLTLETLAIIFPVALRFRRRGVAVEVVGMNEATASLLDRLAMHDKPGAMEMAPGH